MSYVIDTARTQLPLLVNMQIFAYTSYPEHTPYNQGQPLLAALGKQPSCTQEEVYNVYNLITTFQVDLQLNKFNFVY